MLQRTACAAEMPWKAITAGANQSALRTRATRPRHAKTPHSLPFSRPGSSSRVTVRPSAPPGSTNVAKISAAITKARLDGPDAHQRAHVAAEGEEKVTHLEAPAGELLARDQREAGEEHRLQQGGRGPAHHRHDAQAHGDREPAEHEPGPREGLAAIHAEVLAQPGRPARRLHVRDPDRRRAALGWRRAHAAVASSSRACPMWCCSSLWKKSWSFGIVMCESRGKWL